MNAFSDAGDVSDFGDIPRAVDICVAGGGPAGAATAACLALRGYRVLTVDAGASCGYAPVQHLPASIWPLLDAIGAGDAVRRASFLCPTGRVVLWDEPSPRLVPELRGRGAAAGVVVDRRTFDALLRDHARACGARVLAPARARRFRRTPDGWCIEVVGTSGTADVQAHWLVKATGRGPQRDAGRGPARAPRTAALHAWWQPPAAPAPHIRAEAGEAAWYWGAPAGPLPVTPVAGEHQRYLAIAFVDHAAVAGLGRAAREGRYQALLAQSTLLREVLDWRRLGGVMVCDASPTRHVRPVEPGLIRVGDAALAIDPLASQGVQGALRSALQASAVVHTMMRRPQDAAAALRFYELGLERAHREHSRFAAETYARRAALGAGAFWRTRALNEAMAPPAHQPSPVAGWEPLRRETRLRWSATVGWCLAPVLRGEFVELHPAMTHPGIDGPVAYLEGVPLTALLGARDVRTADELHGVLRATAEPGGRSREASDARTWAALERLYGRGVLVPAATAGTDVSGTIGTTEVSETAGTRATAASLASADSAVATS